MAVVELGLSGPTAVASVAIANGATDSDEIDLGYYRLVALYMPAAFTGTSMTFKAAFERGGTYNAVRDESGTAVSITVGTDRVIPLDDIARKIAPMRFLKLVSGSAEGAARTIRLIAKS